jgi:hypothetical protein
VTDMSVRLSLVWAGAGLLVCRSVVCGVCAELYSVWQTGRAAGNGGRTYADTGWFYSGTGQKFPDVKKVSD